MGKTKKQRRVRDLLAVNIPEDQAKLLSNGRLACTVCHHNPVFDTIDMLTIHRSGKKHIQNASYHEEQKRELKELIQKRRQDEFAKTGSTHIKVASQHLKSLSSTVAYDSRVKKLKPYDRKLKVNLSTPPETTFSSSSNKTSEIIKMQSEGPIKHSSQLKHIFTSAPKTELQVRPYERKFDKTGHRISKRKSHSEFVVTAVKGTVVGPTEEVDVSEPHESRTALGSSDVSRDRPTVSGGVAAPSTSTLDSNPDKGTSVKKSQELATKYWQMAGSGWKKDWDGKWIRDEDCEYDSDEETPDLP